MRRDQRQKLTWTYEETNRIGDHIWWISDVRKFQSHYPKLEISLRDTRNSRRNSRRGRPISAPSELRWQRLGRAPLRRSRFSARRAFCKPLISPLPCPREVEKLCERGTRDRSSKTDDQRPAVADVRFNALTLSTSLILFAFVFFRRHDAIVYCRRREALPRAEVKEKEADAEAGRRDGAPEATKIPTGIAPAIHKNLRVYVLCRYVPNRE